MLRVAMMTRIGWQVNEKVNRDRSDWADEIKLEIDSKDEMMHI